jgi:hypothetical protein
MRTPATAFLAAATSDPAWGKDLTSEMGFRAPRAGGGLEGRVSGREGNRQRADGLRWAAVHQRPEVRPDLPLDLPHPPGWLLTVGFAAKMPKRSVL